MELSKNNATALLLDLNKNIEEYADFTVKTIIAEKNFDSLSYPPNCGFTELEKEELNKFTNNEHLKNALRKLIADNSAAIVFNMLNLIDGTTDPGIVTDEWSGVLLVDAEPNPDTESYSDTLHDGFFEMYWEWRKLRGNKDWKLDTYEE